MKATFFCNFFVATICLLLFTNGIPSTSAGPTAGGICSAGCAAVACACYAGAGAVFGTVTAGVGTPAALIACNSAFGTCMANCAVALAMPTP